MSGGSNLIAFEVKGNRAAAFKVANGFQIIKISNNLGDAKSLACHPATTTHQRLTPEQRAHLGIDDGTVRLSVGLEDAGDLEADLRRALDAA
jgi:O-succinylhomoserine sulfhydrylase